MSSTSKKSEHRKGFSRITGLSALKSRLAGLILTEDNSCILLTGPSGSGKKKIANLIAQALLCHAPTAEGACENCTSCHYFDQGNHLDFSILAAESGKKTIPTASVRSELSDLVRYPRLGKRRVILIDADELNEQGQNVLLKTLEEPLPHVRLILTSSDQSRLLPTVISRVISLKVDRRKEDEIRQIIREELVDQERSEGDLLTDDDIRFFAKFASGLPGLALELAGGDWFRQLRSDTTAIYLSLDQASELDLFTDCSAFFLEHKEQIDIIFAVLQSLIRDELCLLWRTEAEIINSDLLPQLKTVIERKQQNLARCAEQAAKDQGLVRWKEEEDSEWSRAERELQDRLATAAGLVEESREALARNVNFELTITRLLLHLKFLAAGDEIIESRKND